MAARAGSRATISAMTRGTISPAAACWCEALGGPAVSGRKPQDRSPGAVDPAGAGGLPAVPGAGLRPVAVLDRLGAPEGRLAVEARPRHRDPGPGHPAHQDGPDRLPGHLR